MRTYLKAAAFGAVTFLSTQAHAADFITYTFYTTGSGITATPNPLTGNVVEQIVSGVTISYVLPTTGFYAESYLFSTADGQRFSAPTGAGNLFGGATVLTANASALGFSESGSAPRGEFGSIAGTACGPVGGVFPTQSFQATPGCGNVSISYFGRGQTLSFRGLVDRVDVAVTTGRPSQINYGIASFVAFVPEPTTWAMMLAGFGMVGYAIRRRRPQITYA